MFSELLFLWLLLVIINNRNKTDFSLSSSTGGALRCGEFGFAV